MDVEVVVGPLPHPAQSLQLREDDRGQLQLVEQGEAAQRVGAAEQPAQLGELALAGGVGGVRRGRPRQRRRAGIDLQAQLGGEAGGAQQAQRVGGEAALADRAQQAAVEVGEAAEGIDRLAAGQWHGDGADREVARGQVGVDPGPPQGRYVDLAAAAVGRDPPGPELGRELEGVLAELARDRAGERLGVAGDRQVEVVHLLPEGGVADGAADDPGALGVAQRPPCRGDQRRVAEAVDHAGRRGTRAEMPQVTS